MVGKERLRYWLLLASCCLLGPRGGLGDEPMPLPWVDGSTTLVLLPDTQWYTVRRHHLFEAQTKWIVSNRDRRRIAYAIHLGDITQHDAASEWEVAKRSLGWLDGQVPYVLVPGNHDYSGLDRGTKLNEYFPVDGMEKWATFGGVFEAGRLESSYHLFAFGGRPWIVLGLEFGPRDEVLRWADRILTLHRDRLAIVATHAYLFRDDRRYDHTQGSAQRASPHPWGNDGEELWQKLLRRHSNVMLVVCGHVRTGGVGYLASAGDHGNVVHQILTDYEALRGGGSAFLRLLEFLPDGKTVQVKAYSPALDQHLTDPRNQFTFRLEPCGGEKAERLDGDRWNRVEARTLADLEGFKPRTVELSQYGGWAEGPRLRSTGFFRTERTRAGWTFVDPEGCLFVSLGLCSVNVGTFPTGSEVERFGSRQAWAERTAGLLRECGFNTLGRWSDAETFRDLRAPFAYTTTLSFMKAYDAQRPPSNGDRGFPERTIPVFDDEFPRFCDRYAERLAATRDDPWLLGHFSDNELPFRPDALSCYLRLPPSDPGHRAASRWLEDRRRSADQLGDRDQLDFVSVVAERYFNVVKDAIRKHDPHHLYLGSRLNGRNINEGTLRGSRPVDVVSINMYHRWSASREELDRWSALSGRPILNSEWYAMSVASPETSASGAGFRVRSQRDRGLFYQNLCLGMLENPNLVGWHWFKYGGDGADSSRGLVDNAFVPHRDMIEWMRCLNAQVYPLMEFLRP